MKVTRSCGHEEEVEFDPAARFAEQRLAKLQSRTCHACTDARVQQEQAAAQAKKSERKAKVQAKHQARLQKLKETGQPPPWERTKRERRERIATAVLAAIIGSTKDFDDQISAALQWADDLIAAVDKQPDYVAQAGESGQPTKE